MPASILNLSLTIPQNEPFFNPRDRDSEWQKFFDATQKVPKNSDVPMIIDGKKIYTTNKLKGLNPSTGEVLCTFQQGDESHAQSAIDAALKAKEAWASLSPLSRIQKFRDLEIILTKWKYDLCATAAVECGYTAVETYVEWAELIDFIRFNNYFYTELLSEQLGDDSVETSSLRLRALKGFTCAVTPFNFPLAIGYHLPLAIGTLRQYRGLETIG